MKTRKILVATTSALLLGLLLTACGESPETMLTSAKAYLAKNDNKAAVIQIKNALQKNPDMAEARYLLGKALMDGGDPVGAQAELRKAMALKHAPDQVVPTLVQAMLAQGQAKKVIEEFAGVKLQDTGANADVQTSLANAYASQGDAESAQAAVQKALALIPKYEPAKMFLARQKAEQRDYEGAMAVVDAVIAASPTSYQGWKLKGDLLRYAKNQLPEALAAYKKSVEIKPDYYIGQVAVTTVLMQEGNLPEVKKQIDQLKKLAPNHLQTKFFQSHLAFQQKEYPLARETIQNVLKGAPGNVQALQLAGAIELAMNSPVQAEVYLSKALQAAPGLTLARRLLVGIYTRTGQNTKALATLQPGLVGDNIDIDLLRVAGEFFLQAGDLKKAEEYFTKASNKNPEDARSRTSLALTRMMGGQVDSAFGELISIASTDKGTTADYALISAHLRRGEYDKALIAIDELEKKQTEKAVVWNLRGRTLLAKKDVAGARKSFEQALTVNPTYFPAVAALANLDLADKKPTDAKKRFDAVLLKEPKNGQALLALAELAARNGAPRDEVAKLIAKAVTANPTDVAPRMLLVQFHMRNKDIKLAQATAQDGVAAIPTSAELMDALGITQLANGETNQAIATFNKFAAMQPMSPQPHMRLADAHMAAKDNAAAAASLRKALEIKPDLQQAQRGSIMLDMVGKNVQGAVATAKTIQKQSPDSPVGYVLEGDIYATQKAWDSAATAYRAGLKQVTSAELAVKLHNALLDGGKTLDAEKFSLGWQKEHPNDTLFLLHLGDRATEKAEYIGAEKYYTTVTKLQPNNAVAFNNLAWVSAKLNKPGALGFAEKALALVPNQPAFTDTLAVLLSDKGEYTKAADLQGKVVAAMPDNHLFRLNFAKIHLKGGRKDLAKKELEAIQKAGDNFAGQKEVSDLLKGL